MKVTAVAVFFCVYTPKGTQEIYNMYKVKLFSIYMIYNVYMCIVFCRVNLEI